MSFDAITRFLYRTADVPDLRNEVRAALEEGRGTAAFEIVKIAQEHGCTFTAAELRAYLVAGPGEVELSRDELAAVAGGIRALEGLDLDGIDRVRGLAPARVREPSPDP